MGCGDEKQSELTTPAPRNLLKLQRASVSVVAALYTQITNHDQILFQKCHPEQYNNPYGCKQGSHTFLQYV